MPAKRSKRPPHKSLPPRREPAESRAAEVLTVAWTVSVTGVFVADLFAAGAYFLAGGNPAAVGLAFLAGVLLLSAATMGTVSLVLFAVVWQARRQKPPPAYGAFAAVAAAAPIAVIVARFLA